MTETSAVVLTAPVLDFDRLEALMAEHSPAVVAYAEKILRDRHLAEDIAQETFLRAWPHAERLLTTAGSIRGWLLTVTRNLIIDRSRSSMARNEVVGADEMLGAGELHALLPDHAESIATSMETLALLHGLSREHREVILHLYVFGHTVREISRLLDIPVGTVKSRHHYALNALRSRLLGERARTAVETCA
ncbi:sigma-70 family RNA polymerase sigma factor (plasmid) [Streptomyces sp. NBC_01450]|uniref:sigma-70 family RNA polymerase sigma factor n=1 Tax=Streptomyces sp. NBC_01450 TaxID=2903871 RepID=UPI002E3348B9|nr:sigma-70 family RNA polymerase sigma factor [Streptomyces sp. NBC_01450]